VLRISSATGEGVAELIAAMLRSLDAQPDAGDTPETTAAGEAR